MKFDKDIILKYVDQIANDEYHRYRSWDICFEAFKGVESKENTILQLAFYLASWGMYRGSSGLLQKNHLVHSGAVDILFSANSQKLKCNQSIEVNINSIKDILQLKNQLAKHYSNKGLNKASKNAKPISPTDTLLSKIMLGTLGCVPAYDRYFLDGLKEMKMQYTKFEAESLHELFKFIENNKAEFIAAQKLISTKTNNHYPLMKIVDMYFWQIGFDKKK